MALEDKRQALSQGKSVEKPGQKTVSPQKEEKNDASILEGKPDMDSRDFLYKLKNQNLYSKTDNLPEERRVEIGGKVFGSYGSKITYNEIENAEKELNLGQYGKFKNFSREEKKDAEKLIKGLKRFRE
jgi:hypothetical protein